MFFPFSALEQTKSATLKRAMCLVMPLFDIYIYLIKLLCHLFARFLLFLIGCARFYEIKSGFKFLFLFLHIFFTEKIILNSKLIIVCFSRCSFIYVCVSGNIRASVHAVPINNQSIKENKTTKLYFLNGGEVTSRLDTRVTLCFARGHFGSAQVYFDHFPSILSSARPSTQAASRRNLNHFPPKHLFPFKGNFMKKHAEAL